MIDSLGDGQIRRRGDGLATPCAQTAIPHQTTLNASSGHFSSSKRRHTGQSRP